MLNTLANHGILPHSGKNLTLDVTVQALIDGVNFTPDLGAFLFDFALTKNPDRNATSFSLHQLGTHGILEHDASLRLFQDFCSTTYQANPSSFLVVQISKYFNVSGAFNKEIFEETTSYWKGDVIDLHEAATSRHARAKTLVAMNPAFTFSSLSQGFVHGEVAALPLVFGDRVAGTAPKALVIAFFGKTVPNKLSAYFKHCGRWLTWLIGRNRALADRARLGEAGCACW